MGRLFSRRKYRDLMLGLALLCAVLALMRWPQESMAAARDGLALCGNVIIPSLFPFYPLQRRAFPAILQADSCKAKEEHYVPSPLRGKSAACRSARL